MISFEKVSKFILSDISLCIPEGIIAGVIGTAGSGKTTLLCLTCGLLEAECGYVRTFFLDPVKKRKQISSDIRFFSSDSPVFREDNTILYEFQRLCVMYRMEQKDFWKQYRELAGKLCFREYEEKEIRSLSLGQKRRAQLASILLGNPRLILLDEPTAGVDALGKEIFREQLKKRKESGTTIVIASENMSEIEQLCDRVILLNKGHLLYYGEQKRLMRRYVPENELEIVINGMLPDMEDLPLIWYNIKNHRMKFRYDSNIISASEIINHIAGQTSITQINMIRPKLEDVVLSGKEERGNELLLDFHEKGIEL